MTTALELRGVHKRFGPVHALRGADFALATGEVHALLGANGAGKSTLMNIAGGLLRPDAGVVAVRGAEHVFHSPREAQSVGIGVVHQHFTAIPALTVGENVALAAGWPVSSPRDLRTRVAALSERLSLPLDPEAVTGELPVGARQRLEILKALAAEARILLLDEPTAVLTPAEADELLARLRRFAAGGGAAVLVTHKLDEALRAADRITVLRAGQAVRTASARDESAPSLAEAMLGSGEQVSVPQPVPRRDDVDEEPAIRCRNVTLTREDGRGVALRFADLEVRQGEVVGIAAVEGSGQRELLRAIAGLHRLAAGTLTVAHPVGFIPEDRTTEGLILDFTLVENVALGLGPRAPWVRRGRIDWRAVRRRAAHLVSRFRIRAGGVDLAAATLSGGNQQKLVVGRALELAPRVVVAENPSRGLDVQAARSVWAELRRAAAADAAVVVWSSDLDELLVNTDRWLVVARGSMQAAPAGAGRATIGAMMLTTGFPA